MGHPCSILSGGPHYLGLFLVSPLGSLDCPLSFTRSKVTRENASADPQRLARTKSPDAATTALYRGQEDSTAGETVGKAAVAPSCAQIPTTPRPQGCWRASQRQQTDTCESVSDPQGCLRMIPLREWGPDDAGGYVVCAPHWVLACWAELL